MRPVIRNRKEKAIVLLSGGLDSATTLYFAKSKGYSIIALIFDYGQRHKKEIIAARRIVKAANCNYQIINLRLPIRGSSLLNRELSIPKAKLKEVTLARRKARIPSTYVPARNLIFLSIAASFAESLKVSAIFIGANAIDFSGYPDCRPFFYSTFRKTIKAGTKAGAQGKSIKIFTPLIKKSKKDIVRLANRLGVPFELTWSCYKGVRFPCGVCESCAFRRKGFQEAGIEDPLINYGR